MTNTTDSIKEREEKFGPEIDTSPGVPIDGFSDPNGEYPNREYF